MIRIRTVLIGILDENAQLLYAQLNGSAVIGHTAADADQHRDHRVDALVQETHRRGAVWECRNRVTEMCNVA